MSYVLPWQGQVMVPLATPATVQPMWVQTALKALNSPALGWVTTIFAVSKTLPPPTGMSATLNTSFAEPAELVLSLPPPHAARVTAPVTPTTTVPMTVRRPMAFVGSLAVKRWSGWLTKSSSRISGAWLPGRQRTHRDPGSPSPALDTTTLQRADHDPARRMREFPHTNQDHGFLGTNWLGCTLTVLFLAAVFRTAVFRTAVFRTAVLVTALLVTASACTTGAKVASSVVWLAAREPRARTGARNCPV